MSRIKRYLEEVSEEVSQPTFQNPYQASYEDADFQAEMAEFEDAQFMENFDENMIEMAHAFGQFDDDEFNSENPFAEMQCKDRSYREMSRGW